MISIRNNCFETNSSSMHSLVIAKNSKRCYDEDDLNLRKDYRIRKEDNVYELFKYPSDVTNYERHPFQVLDQPIDKLRYLVGLYVRWKDNPETDDSEYYLDPEAKKEFDSIIKEATGCSDIQYYYFNDYNEEKEYPYTSVTNDSGENVYSFMKRKGLSFKDVIFNPNITIQVDGDEYQEFKKLFESGLISKDSIEDISSGLDFWFEERVTIWIDELYSTKLYQGANKTYYKQLVDDDYKQFTNKTTCEVYCMNAKADIPERNWKRLRDLLIDKNIHRVGLYEKEWSQQNREMFNKYFNNKEFFEVITIYD